MKLKKIFLFLSAIFTTIIFLSCKYDLVSEPTSSGSFVKNPADYSDSIKAPASVTASCGGYKSITLSWTKVENAVQYIIYSADTAFDTFEQIYETTGTETTCTIDEEAGTTKYYCVSAVNYFGTISSKSKIVQGASLSMPTILSVTASSEGDSLTVEWWMDNQEFYEDVVQYNIYTYSDEGKTKVPDTDLILYGSDLKGNLSATISGLNSNTEYYFVVEAIIINSDQKSEKCEPTSASTSHKIIPDCPQNFTVTQGSSKNGVTLSWELPSAVDYYDSTTSSYTTNPVYFKVYRKLASAEKYPETPAAVIGCVTNSTWTVTDSSSLHFDCLNQTADSSVTVTKAAEGISAGENYAEYISGSTITYTDTIEPENRGKQYSYYIQSFTDNSKKVYTSDNSKTEELTGWAMNIPYFSAKSENQADGTALTGISVTFTLNFDAENVNYTYVITATESDQLFDNTIQTYEEKIAKQYSSISDLQTEKLCFGSTEECYAAIPSDRVSYYTYRLYILPFTEAEQTTVPSADQYLDFASAAGKTTVTDDLSKIPVIEDFNVADGYASKFILSWKNEGYDDSSSIYTIYWNNIDSNGMEQEEQSLALTKDDYTAAADGKIYYSHSAASGENRKYTLEVNTGITFTESLTETYKTLGTPALTFASPDYSAITVSWNSVQKADSGYQITAAYAEDGASILADNYTLATDDSGLVTCVITNPSGYDDITKSGKPVTMTVKTSNSTTGDFTESNITVRTLGPALTETVADTTDISADKLKVCWNKVEGACGYIIYRTKYNYDSSWTKWSFEKADTYYYDAAQDTDSAEGNGKVSISGTEIDLSRAAVSLSDGKYTLTDKDCAQGDSNGAYEINQSQISWGIPFGYVVIPVKNSKDDFTFGNDSEYLKVTGGKAGIIYTTAFTDQKTAAYGYGLNVAAAKAESAATQTISWSTPYFNTLTPTLYRRLAGTDNSWERVENPAFNTTQNQAGCSYDPSGNDAVAKNSGFTFDRQEYLPYEYSVKYGAGTGSSSTSFTESFQTRLSETEENNENYDYTGVEKEQLNKGYLLNLPFSAGFGGTLSDGTAVSNEYLYSEKVQLEPWDYKNRSLGPDSYTIYVYNSDLGDEWYKAAAFNKDLSSSELETLSDTTMLQDGTSLRLWPAAIKNGTKQTSTGPLKVIRDAKHYYKLEMKRNDTGTDKYFGEDKSVYGYRELTDEEFCKTAMYIFAYGFYINDGGTANFTDDSIKKQYTYGGEGEHSGVTGTAIFTARSTATSELGIGKYKQYYTYANYCPLLYTPSGNYVTAPLKISCAQKSAGIKGNADNYIYTFRDTHDFTVETGDSVIPLKYTATINFACSDKSSLTLKLTRNGSTTTVIDTSDNTTRKKWFPMQIHSDTCYLFKPSTTDSTDYGWWN